MGRVERPSAPEYSRVGEAGLGPERETSTVSFSFSGARLSERLG
jgi:hypothetical protein